MKAALRKTGKTTAIVLFNLLAIAVILYGFDLLFSPYRRLPKDGVYGEEEYTWGQRVETNRYGFRERDFEVPKPPGVYRVMVLGDSFTWGTGLAAEERYTAVAESLLNQGTMGVQFEVLNFGVNGASTVQEKNLLRKYLKEVEPDLIVLTFVINDPQTREMNYSPEREQLDRSGGALVDKVSKWLHSIGLRYLAQTLNDAFYAAFERLGVIPDWQTALGRAYKPSSDEWTAFQQALGAIKEMSDRRGLPGPVFAVLNHGTSATQPTDYRNPDELLELYLAWCHQAEAAASEAGYIVYNHEGEIGAELNGVPLAVNPLDPHPSAELNRIYGEKLYQTILEILTSQ